MLKVSKWMENTRALVLRRINPWGNALSLLETTRAEVAVKKM